MADEMKLSEDELKKLAELERSECEVSKPYPPQWPDENTKPGDMLLGKVIEMREITRRTSDGRVVDNELAIVTGRIVREKNMLEEGSWTVWKRKQLENLFKQPVGTLAKIEYMGASVSKIYYNFDVETRRGLETGVRRPR
jgi:hypothetical protein